ncbi:MAG: SH3 domain-containing protein [Prevotella sp.]|jgi:hypothetical protein|nr:SH3 domain-containing protein [Prevotella sp.]
MKRILFVVILLISISGLQAQTTTEKWNSIYQRWEYYDSQHNLIGYKKKNLYGQWEYTDVQKQKQEQQRRNEPLQPYHNYGLIERALSQKQQLYDKRHADIVEIVSRINSYIGDVLDAKKIFKYDKNKDLENYEDALTKIGNLDLTINQNYSYSMNWLLNFEKDIYKWELVDIYELQAQTNISKPQQSHSKGNEYKRYSPGVYNVYEHSPIMDGIHVTHSKEIAKSGKTIEVLEKVTDRYYKVKTHDGIIGYFDLILWVK